MPVEAGGGNGGEKVYDERGLRSLWMPIEEDFPPNNGDTSSHTPAETMQLGKRLCKVWRVDEPLLEPVLERQRDQVGQTTGHVETGAIWLQRLCTADLEVSCAPWPVVGR